MDTQPQLWAFAVAVPLGIFSWMCWSGRWRSWVEAQTPYPNAIPITSFPGLAVFFGAFGVATLPFSPLTDVFGALGMFLGLVLGIFSFCEPAWYGPRWYRRYKRAFLLGKPGGLASLPEDPRRPGESSVQATERHMASDRPLPPGKQLWLVDAPFERLVEVEGLTCALMFYPHAPLFSSSEMVSEPVEEVVPREFLVDVHVQEAGRGPLSLFGLSRQRLSVETTEGTWVFATRRASKVARTLRQRYLDDSTDLYGLPLRRDW